MMRGDGLEHAADQRADFQRLVVGHGDVMCAVDLGRQPDVRAFLPHSLLAQHAQRAGHVLAGELARDSHVASTSSRTKWSRISRGIGPGTPSPKWHCTASRTMSRSSSMVSPCVAMA